MRRLEKGSRWARTDGSGKIDSFGVECCQSMGGGDTKSRLKSANTGKFQETWTTRFIDFKKTIEDGG
jgi:hypothetical protein